MYLKKHKNYSECIEDFKLFLNDFDSTESICGIIKKMSKRGFSTNKRIVHFLDDYLFYYSKIPINFSDNYENLTQCPKIGICLSDILESTKIEEDLKSHRKIIYIEFPSFSQITFKKSKENPLITKNISLINSKPITINLKTRTKWIFGEDPTKKDFFQFFIAKIEDSLSKVFKKPLSIEEKDNIIENKEDSPQKNDSLSSKPDNISYFPEKSSATIRKPEENINNSSENNQEIQQINQLNSEKSPEKSENKHFQHIGRTSPSLMEILEDKDKEKEKDKENSTNKQKKGPYLTKNQSLMVPMVPLSTSYKEISPKKSILQQFKNKLFQNFNIKKSETKDLSTPEKSLVSSQEKIKDEPSQEKIASFEGYVNDDNSDNKNCISLINIPSENDKNISLAQNIDRKKAILIDLLKKQRLSRYENKEYDENEDDNSQIGMLKKYKYSTNLEELKLSMKNNIHLERLSENNEFIDFKELKKEKEKKTFNNNVINYNYEDLFYEKLNKNDSFSLDFDKMTNANFEILSLLNDFSEICLNSVKKKIDELSFLIKENIIILDEGNNLEINICLKNQKSISQIFKDYEYLLNCFVNSRKKGKNLNNLRVPLCCLIDYKGIKAFVKFINNEEIKKIHEFPDFIKDFFKENNIEFEYLEIIETSKGIYLFNPNEIKKKLPEILIEDINKSFQSDFSLFFKENFKQFLKKNEISCKYLGIIFENSDNSLIKSFIIEEMISRSIKEIFRKVMIEFQLNKITEKASNSKIENISISKLGMFDLLKDFMNLISQKNCVFNDIIIKLVCNKYKINENIEFFKNSWNFYSILSHCKIKFFNNEQNHKNEIGEFICKTKSIYLKNLPLIDFYNKKQNINDLNLKEINILEKIENLLGFYQENKYFRMKNEEITKIRGEILLKIQDFSDIYMKIQLNSLLLNNSINNLNEKNILYDFERISLEIIKNYGENHFFFTVFLSKIGFYYQKICNFEKAIEYYISATNILSLNSLSNSIYMIELCLDLSECHEKIVIYNKNYINLLDFT